MKCCTYCKTEKPIEDFVRRKDKWKPYCKECQYAYLKQYYAKNRDKLLEQQREYRAESPLYEALLPARRRRIALHRSEGRYRERERKNASESRARYPEHHAARRKVNDAVRRGVLVKPSCCEQCGKQDRAEGRSIIQGHHYAGYHNPLVVKWLCQRCHSWEHSPRNPKALKDSGGAG